MNILHEGDRRPPIASAAAVGFFDGMHFGHRFLLENVKAIARARNLATMAVTFAQHPLAVLHPESTPLLLSTTGERIALLESQGIDLCAVLDFTKELSMLSAREFMLEYLVQRLNVKALIVGYDHSIGHDTDTTFEHYRETGEKLGICVVRAAKYLPPSGENVSSTNIRRALGTGNVRQAAAMLGRSYTLSGTVVEGRHIGTQIGFPTANIDVSRTEKMIPAGGVYAAQASIGNDTHTAVVNIGTRPTLNNGSDISVEVHIPGFSGNLYGRQISIAFTRRLRDEKRFDSLETLRAQIAADTAEAMKITR
jgi:riboflavin kinase / FMN adenylyltransferase